MTEIGLDTAIGRQRLVLESLVIDELGFVDQEPRKGQRVAAARSVLGDDYRAGTVVERNDVLILGRLNDGLAEGLGRSPTNDVMDTVDIPPPFPCRQQARDGVGQAMLVGGYHNATGATSHALHVAQHKGRGDRIRLAGSSPRHDDGGIGANQLRQALRGVKVYLLRGLLHRFSLHRGTVSVPPGQLPQTRYPRYPCFLPGICAAVPGCVPAGGEWA